jgi:hypothetical protein
VIRRALLVAVGLLAFVIPSAGAQSVPPFVFTLLGDPTLSLTEVRNVPLHVTGAITITFSPDTASGCGAHAACAYAGRVTVSLGQRPRLELTTYRSRGRMRTDGDIISGAGGSAALTYADVRRVAGGECSDVAQDDGLIGHPRGGAFTFSIADAVSPTRCAAPLPADVARLLPSLRLSGHPAPGRHFDLRATHTFSAHGFTGTVRSTLVVTVGAGGSTTPSSPSAGAPKVRAVSTSVRVTASPGTVRLSVAGSRDPHVCALLDSCGLAGTVVLDPRIRSASGRLTALGPVRRPRLDYLTALGLAHGGNPHGIQVTGVVALSQTGTVTSAMRQGGLTCADTAPIGTGLLVLGGTGGRLGVFSPFLPPGRTRCPGPQLATFTNGLAGIVPRQRTRDGAVTVVLAPFGTPGDDGYTLSQHGRLTLRLHRGPISDRVVVNPFG